MARERALTEKKEREERMALEKANEKNNYKQPEKPKKQFGINRKNMNPNFMQKNDSNMHIEGDVEILVNPNQHYVPPSEESNVVEQKNQVKASKNKQESNFVQTHSELGDTMMPPPCAF